MRSPNSQSPNRVVAFLASPFTKTNTFWCTLHSLRATLNGFPARTADCCRSHYVQQHSIIVKIHPRVCEGSDRISYEPVIVTLRVSDISDNKTRESVLPKLTARVRYDFPVLESEYTSRSTYGGQLIIKSASTLSVRSLMFWLLPVIHSG